MLPLRPVVLLHSDPRLCEGENVCEKVHSEGLLLPLRLVASCSNLSPPSIVSPLPPLLEWTWACRCCSDRHSESLSQQLCSPPVSGSTLLVSESSISRRSVSSSMSNSECDRPLDLQRTGRNLLPSGWPPSGSWGAGEGSVGGESSPLRMLSLSLSSLETPSSLDLFAWEPKSRVQTNGGHQTGPRGVRRVCDHRWTLCGMLLSAVWCLEHLWVPIGKRSVVSFIRKTRRGVSVLQQGSGPGRIQRHGEKTSNENRRGRNLKTCFVWGNYN